MFPLVVKLAGVVGLFHWKSGVPVTPPGSTKRQVRVTLSPAMTVNDNGVRDIETGSVEDGIAYSHS